MSANTAAALTILAFSFGVLLLTAAAVWQLYVMLTETYSLNRYQGSRLFLVVMALFFSFSFAVYYFCPNARKKGWIFLALTLLGIVLYGLGVYGKGLYASGS